MDQSTAGERGHLGRAEAGDMDAVAGLPTVGGVRRFEPGVRWSVSSSALRMIVTPAELGRLGFGQGRPYLRRSRILAVDRGW
jgi:hypothetical protein